ncbi:unnamed protein product [Mycetohabitans rhizoxinica HKI 454]|uniref:Uncharacterized protein n=1 Tax=Mycetohabitans rhizoxinica (strain DSM 19002 / CIP 109453 / HKI 454) TaxID=882378 RepID=E5ARB7_MYCRK|nr:unnamed protein product [Mycetohabitans rhizoxinica HKI 454]
MVRRVWLAQVAQWQAYAPAQIAVIAFVLEQGLLT